MCFVCFRAERKQNQNQSLAMVSAVSAITVVGSKYWCPLVEGSSMCTGLFCIGPAPQKKQKYIPRMFIRSHVCFSPAV